MNALVSAKTVRGSSTRREELTCARQALWPVLHGARSVYPSNRLGVEGGCGWVVMFSGLAVACGLVGAAPDVVCNDTLPY